MSFACKQIYTYYKYYRIPQNFFILLLFSLSLTNLKILTETPRKKINRGDQGWCLNFRYANLKILTETLRKLAKEIKFDVSILFRKHFICDWIL